VNKPVLINIGDGDQMIDTKGTETAKEIFSKKKDAEVIVYTGAVHGFTVRGDHNNDEEKKNKEKAAEATINFFHKYLA